MVRVVLPQHLRTLAHIVGETLLDVAHPVTQRSVLDALEARYPMLRGTMRDHVTLKRRPFIRFFACEQDLSHHSPDLALPDAVATGTEPLLIVGALAGGTLAMLATDLALNGRHLDRVVASRVAWTLLMVPAPVLLAVSSSSRGFDSVPSWLAQPSVVGARAAWVLSVTALPPVALALSVWLRTHADDEGGSALWAPAAG